MVVVESSASRTSYVRRTHKNQERILMGDRGGVSPEGHEWRRENTTTKLFYKAPGNIIQISKGIGNLALKC